MRFALLIATIAIASTSFAQERIFRASQIDLQQNERLDKIESNIARLTAIVEDVVLERKVSSVAQPVAVAAPTQQKLVRIGDEKVIAGKSHRLEIVSSEPRWMPVYTQPSQPAVTQPAVASNRLTTSEIRSQIWSMRPSGWTGPVYADVQPRSWAKQHLTGEHGYTLAQVSGLSQEEAVILHDLRHGGKVSPFRSGAAMRSEPVAIPEPVEIFAPEFEKGCPDGQCPLKAIKAAPRRGLFRR